LHEHQLTNKKVEKVKEEVDYPQLQPKHPQELVQVDIVPHYLTGGEKAPCFNAIDVVSRYPTGQAYHQRRSQDACDFLLHVWQELGVPTYTQVDNEGCFGGGHTHPRILGKVARLALAVGTELVFSPFYHPQSNAFVERFHQDYNLHVWDNTYLQNHQAINDQADRFYQLYRQRLDHCAIEGQSPAQLHGKPGRRLLPTFKPKHPLPLRTGKLHFMRRVDHQGTIKVLNAEWAVPEFDPGKGVWATLDLQLSGTNLLIYDAAPDVALRQQLASYPFQMVDPILPWSAKDVLLQENPTAPNVLPPVLSQPSPWLQIPAIADDLIQVGRGVLHLTFNLTAHLAGRLFDTIY
jgi:hypothetical protein